jgi:hypothetical protein
MNTETESPVVVETQGELSKVQQLLERMYPRGRIADERRAEARYPFPYLIELFPVESDGVTPAGESFTVVGKHISESGIGFYHSEPMPFRYVVAALDIEDEPEPIFLLLDLTWCRFARKGWYENGGALLGETDVPVGAS